MKATILSGLAMVIVLAMVEPVGAAMCKKCRGRVHDNQFGTCRECRKVTWSTEFQLCESCSLELLRCTRCMDKLGLGSPGKPPPIDHKQTGSYSFGSWAYRLEVTQDGRAVVARHGRLAYGGKEVPNPKINDHYKTPWGTMYWIGTVPDQRGYRGWLMGPHLRYEMGQKLTPPVGTARKVDLTDGDTAKTIKAFVGAPITITLSGNPTTGHRWRVDKITGQSVIATVRRPTYVADQGRPGTVGSGGKFTFKFKAAKPGKSTIKLAYGKSFDAYSRPARTFVVTIDVPKK